MSDRICQDILEALSGLVACLRGSDESERQDFLPQESWSYVHQDIQDEFIRHCSYGILEQSMSGIVGQREIDLSSIDC